MQGKWQAMTDSSQQPELEYEDPATEMISEDEPIAWVAKSAFTRSQAKKYAASEMCIDFIDVRSRTCWIRGLTAEEREGDEFAGGYGCEKDHPAAVEFWEVRDVRA